MSDIQKQAEERPLEKMTVKALREMAIKIPEITCVHGRKPNGFPIPRQKGKPAAIVTACTTP